MVLKKNLEKSLNDLKTKIKELEQSSKGLRSQFKHLEEKVRERDEETKANINNLEEKNREREVVSEKKQEIINELEKRIIRCSCLGIVNAITGVAGNVEAFQIFCCSRAIILTINYANAELICYKR
ncbi:4563_t:CDS:2 [Funneliformis mosseae]|uniref:4563_t:CDS:1 n=1 Tax=Funneliformis mosseae TaxID=27381 RepID=A0A9N8W1X0_FUNMO|nr:4563_t:CDS:2 [Funneliformis mosseae]